MSYRKGQRGGILAFSIWERPVVWKFDLGKEGSGESRAALQKYQGTVWGDGLVRKIPAAEEC